MIAAPETVLHGDSPRFGIRRVHRDAGLVAVSSVASAALGVGFWAFAAKFIVPEQLGVMTAVLAVIVSTGSVVASGVGDAYTALLPAVGPARVRVYRRGQRIFFGLAAVASVLGALLTIVLLREVRVSRAMELAVAALVVVGIMTWAAGTLQNSTLVAIGRARWVPVVNVSVGLAKIVLLPSVAFTLAWHSVELAAIIATAVAVLMLRPVLYRIISTGDDLPASATISEHKAVNEFNRLVVRTVPLAALGMGVLALTPFIVTLFAGPSQGALFALSFSIVSLFDFIGAAMAVSLVVHASSAPEHTGAMARTILIRAGALTTVGTLGLVAVVPPVLRMLNPEYGRMGTLSVIAVLCLATVTRVAYLVWAAVQQSRRELRMPLIFNAVAAVLLLSVMPVLCGAFGALGGALAMLIHQVSLTGAAAVHFAVNQSKGRAARHARA